MCSFGIYKGDFRFMKSFVLGQKSMFLFEKKHIIYKYNIY